MAMRSRGGQRNQSEPAPRRLRRLHRVWPDPGGNISYLLTVCVDGRVHVLANELTFERLSGFLLGSPNRYGWFARRFIIMPDHIHLIVQQGREAVRLGQWVKALKAVTAGLEPLQHSTSVLPRASTRKQANDAARSVLGPEIKSQHQLTRTKRAWRWQAGFHDHKFRSCESEERKWVYLCLNPVRYGYVERPEQWPYGGEVLHDDPNGPRVERGTPPLLDTGMLVEEQED